MQARSPDGIPIAYETHGAGSTALVFVHGWSCDRTYWAAQIEPFARAFRVVTVDLAGHGESGVGRTAWTMGAFGGDVAAVVEALGPERAVLIGHSMGGDVIVEAARRLPGRVAGLIWVDVYKGLGPGRTLDEARTRIGPFRASFQEATREFVRGMFPPGADRSLVERVAADMSSAPPEVALPAMESAMTCKAEIVAALEELRLPAVAINPDDHPSDLESMDRHGFEVVLMPGLGHFPMMEDPARFNALLSDAVERLLLRV
jgi:pimeloyl-ACP methyl ester carboxylesterase